MSRFEYEQGNFIEGRAHRFANKRRIACSFIGNLKQKTHSKVTAEAKKTRLN